MGKILCKIGIHLWVITKWSRFSKKSYNSHKPNKLLEEGFDRECDKCKKRQRLEKPKYYDPVAYVWTNVS